MLARGCATPLQPARVEGKRGELSERRADTVRDYMVSKGISARITTRGFGKARPVASNQTADGRAENRRVEIIAE
ncbi:MAG: OmpA family protein [Deltaproteobacteria bacterium]|nr:MAG: OmpA family protein [Deltaproteobacteria bacterium]TMB12164.1 MAG: OmpA family protein [Deltaproteobacteria bacterium]